MTTLIDAGAPARISVQPGDPAGRHATGCHSAAGSGDGIPFAELILSLAGRPASNRHDHGDSDDGSDTGRHALHDRDAGDGRPPTAESAALALALTAGPAVARPDQPDRPGTQAASGRAAGPNAVHPGRYAIPPDAGRAPVTQTPDGPRVRGAAGQAALTAIRGTPTDTPTSTLTPTVGDETRTAGPTGTPPAAARPAGSAGSAGFAGSASPAGASAHATHPMHPVHLATDADRTAQHAGARHGVHSAAAADAAGRAAAPTPPSPDVTGAAPPSHQAATHHPATQGIPSVTAGPAEPPGRSGEDPGNGTVAPSRAASHASQGGGPERTARPDGRLAGPAHSGPPASVADTTSAAVPAFSPTAPTVPTSPSTGTPSFAPLPVALPQPELAGSLARLRGSADGTYQLIVSLHPADLGTVQVVATIAHGSVTVVLSSPDQAARAAVAESLPQLRQHLAGAGFTGVDVGLGAPQQDHRQPASGRRDADPGPVTAGGRAGPVAAVPASPAVPAPSRQAFRHAALDRWL